MQLTRRKDGRWCKQIHNKMVYFGRDSYSDALAEYREYMESLASGVVPSRRQSTTLGHVLGEFMQATRRRLDRGKIAMCSYGDYLRTCGKIADAIAPDRDPETLRPSDFSRMVEYMERDGLADYAIDGAIRRTRRIFTWAMDAEKIHAHIRFGPDFQVEKKSAKYRRTMTPAQCRALLDVSSGSMRAMILLALNGGLGNTDCSEMRDSHLDLASGVLTFPRPKTGIQRVVPLWSATADAIAEARASRAKAADPADDDRVFLTARGRPWVRDHPKMNGDKIVSVSTTDAIAQETHKLMVAAGIKRVEGVTKKRDAKGIMRTSKGRIVAGKGLGFYTLRHVFGTLADEVRDHNAVSRVLGHALPGIRGVYVEDIAIDRLRAVTEHVHSSLFPNPQDCDA